MRKRNGIEFGVGVYMRGKKMELRLRFGFGCDLGEPGVGGGMEKKRGA